MNKYLKILLLLIMACPLVLKAQKEDYKEKHRPQVHFSPQQNWMNDPNGMVYFNNTYHLFFQYYPKATVWGPMHWGHATSKDLIHWKQKPVALFPDSLGYIFSGSAVVDSNNTSGFGKNGKIPLVAIFTHHDPKGEKEGKDNYQNESLAYSLDDGNTWKKYSGNPVLKNPGIKDFRDPKVRWFASQKKWVMTLATKNKVTFYSSKNLKNWFKESDFGLETGAHGGVWECPDLFPLTLNNKIYWVLLVSINPGGPNKGSATQYFIGRFDGKTFVPMDTTTRWIDYGPDDYAGITWSNTSNRMIFLGWMSNWLYANQVPTKTWRNAMTIPRELSLKKQGSAILLASQPIKELSSISTNTRSFTNLAVAKKLDLTTKTGKLPEQYELKMRTTQLKDYMLTLFNNAGEKLLIGYNSKEDQYYIDRSKSGQVRFNKEFSGKFFAPRFTSAKSSDLTLIVDASSVELFADEGQSVMTCTFFPSKPFDQVSISANNFSIQKLEVVSLKSIWR